VHFSRCQGHWEYGLTKCKVNLSTPRPEGRSLLEVHPEPRSSTLPPKAGLRVVERVNEFNYVPKVRPLDGAGGATLLPEANKTIISASCADFN
jgi:hypothetical protein